MNIRTIFGKDRNGWLIVPLLMVLLLASSCQKELPDSLKNVEVNQGGQDENPVPTPSQELKVSEPGQFGAKGGEQTITITATATWTISKSSGNAWLTIKPESGNAGTSQVTLTVAENTLKEVRTATITIRSGNLTKTVDVSQSAAEAVLLLDTNSLEFTSGSGSKMFRISSNMSWAISSDQYWCSVSPTSGSGDSSVTVSVQENTSTSSRTATVTVESASITLTLAVTQSGAAPPSQDRTFTVGGVQFKMIAVEGGTFTMGATSEQGSDALDREKPTHSVTLSSYSIGETEVTQALWQAVMGSNPSSSSGNNRPVEMVSWNDCQDFITKLNAMTGENFRLPTEAEWEFAARGGNKSRGYKYAGSNTIDDVAWFGNNSVINPQKPDYGTHAVATKLPNELGLYDMSGNVLEWCNDWYGDYSSSAQTNPTGPVSGDRRVIRGGSWLDSAGLCRISYREDVMPTLQNSTIIGFRLAL